MLSAERLYYVKLKTTDKDILSVFGFAIDSETDDLWRLTDVNGNIQYLDPENPYLGFEDINDAIQLAQEGVIIIQVTK